VIDPALRSSPTVNMGSAALYEATAGVTPSAPLQPPAAAAIEPPPKTPVTIRTNKIRRNSMMKARKSNDESEKEKCATLRRLTSSAVASPKTQQETREIIGDCIGIGYSTQETEDDLLETHSKATQNNNA